MLKIHPKTLQKMPRNVVSEALKLLFRKDDEFRRWLGQHTSNHNHEQIEGGALTKTA